MADLTMTTDGGERPVHYPPEAILTPDDVARWLDVSTKQIMRWPIRRAQLGGRTVRFFARDVYAFLESRAA